MVARCFSHVCDVWFWGAGACRVCRVSSVRPCSSRRGLDARRVSDAGATRGVPYLTQLCVCVCAISHAAMPVPQASTMSTRVKDDAGQLDMEQFDCVSAGRGEPWRDYKLRASRILAGKVDDSASSLADAQIDAGMGGALGPPLPPAGNADAGRTMDAWMDGWMARASYLPTYGPSATRSCSSGGRGISPRRPFRLATRRLWRSQLPT